MYHPPQLNLSSVEISENNREKGFHAGWDNVPEKLMLVVTELAEAMEAYRKQPVDNWIGYGVGGTFVRSSLDAYDNFVEEIADTFIRLMDLVGALGLDIDQAIVNKVEFNKTRPFKHGKSL